MTKSFILLSVLVLASVQAISQQFELLQPSSFTSLSRCSSDFGDYDNDGDLDILISGRTGPTTFFTKVYRNDGNDAFSEVNFNLHNKEFGTSMWGDYNNDGYLDIIFVGQDIADQYLTRVYRNEQGVQFEEVQLNLESFYHLFSSWIDFDGNGSLDISITTGSGSHGGQILQNSDDNFELLNVNLPSIEGDQAMTYADFDFDGDIDLLYPNSIYINDNWTFRDSTVAISSGGNKSWVDYDSDGDLDILSDNILYENQAGSIVQNSFIFNGIGSASWGDFDHDNDLDLLVATNVYRNLGDGDFELLADDLNNSGEMHWGQLWADIDNDNDLDILYGDRLYKNLDNTQSGNTNIPNNLSANYASETKTIHFAWIAPEFSNKFSFNYFLLDHNKEVIIAPTADTTNGFRRVAREGNVGNKLHHNLSANDLGIGKFYWAIQSIDNRYLGSPFSSMDSFEIKPEINGEIADQNCLGTNSTLTLNGTFDESVSFDIRAEGAEVMTVSYNQFSFSWETSGFKQIEIVGIQNGASSDTLTLSIEVNPIFNETASATICEGDSYVFGSQTLTTEGEFIEVFQSVNDCDSTVVLTLSVNPIFNETASATICEGDSYVFGSQTLTTEGEFTEVFQSVNDCDSTVVLTLSVNPIFNETASATICEGDSYVFGSQTLTTEGEFTEVFQSVNDCDSTVVLTLSVNPIFNETASATICEGDSYVFGSQTLTTEGEFIEVFQSVNDCDSTVVLTLSVNPIFNETASATICEGDSYVFGSQTLTTEGEFTEVFQSVNDCDSTVVLTLSVNPIFNETASATICEGDSYVFGSQTLTTEGEFTEVFQSVNDCDSTVVLTLSVNPIFNETASATICERDSYVFGSQTLTTEGEFIEVFQSVNDCDSTVVLTLSVNPIFNETASATICEGDSYVFGSQTLTTEGEFTEVFQSVNDCDSTVVLTLSIECVLGTNLREKTSYTSIYPNPTLDFVNISFNRNFFGFIELYDLAGRIIKRQSIENQEEVTLKLDVPNGTHILIVKDEAGNINSYRIIKE